MMRVLEKQDCSVLTLPLCYKWYDLIDAGVKREEYRDLMPWSVKIANWVMHFDYRTKPRFQVVAFMRGYEKPSMWFLASLKPCRHMPRHPEWGEEPGTHYVIHLDERVLLT